MKTRNAVASASAVVLWVLLMLVLVPLLDSCTFPLNLCGYTEGGLDMDVMEAWEQTAKFTYIPEDGTDYWKSPVEFERDGGGDCEDFATYMMYLLGTKSRMAIMLAGTSGRHAVVWFDGKFMEPQWPGGHYTSLTVLQWLEWGEVMSLATAGGMKCLTSDGNCGILE